MNPIIRELAIALRAVALFDAHYAARPHITERDASMMAFYWNIARGEIDGDTPDHEALRREMGGSFE